MKEWLTSASSPPPSLAVPFTFWESSVTGSEKNSVKIYRKGPPKGHNYCIHKIGDFTNNTSFISKRDIMFIIKSHILAISVTSYIVQHPIILVWRKILVRHILPHHLLGIQIIIWPVKAYLEMGAFLFWAPQPYICRIMIWVFMMDCA